MVFFNSKEEVIEIKLTQFGKNCLSRGAFKPAYYQFFDDGILYNSQNAGITETQNETEGRILNDTAYLKSQYLCSSVQTQYSIDDEMIVSGTLDRFRELKKNYDPDIQDVILIYPLGEKESAITKVPAYNIVSLSSQFVTGNVPFLTGSDIIRKIPQITCNPKHTILLDSVSTREQAPTTGENFIDTLSEGIEFSDGTSINIQREDFVIDVQELNAFFGLDNFEVEIFRIETEGSKELLKKLDSMEEIRNFFDIKTDEDVDLSNHKIKNMSQTNYRKRGES